MNYNLYHHFSASFPPERSQPAIVDASGVAADFAKIESRSAQWANLLMGLGASEGDRVTVQVDKSLEALFLYLGVLRAGLVFHPLNTAYQEGELSYFLGNAEPRLVIGDRDTVSTLHKVAPGAAEVFDITTLATEVEKQPKAFDTAISDDQALAALLYSSGTTGLPKGIMLSHRNLLTNAQTLIGSWGFTADDVLLHALPIFHVHGLFVATGCALLSGSKMYWLNSFDLTEVLSAMPNATVMMGVPTYYTRLLSTSTFNRQLTENMRLFISGSAPLLSETFQQFQTRTGHDILERYGMTETGMNTSNPLEGERRPGTVGPALPGVQVRVCDSSNRELPTGEVGGVQVRGQNVFQGYWKLPEKTTEDFTDDGFFDTGDQGFIDGDGYLSIVGREKDMIITGGLNVYPKEIELLIDELPGVSESAVIGVQHADFGEGVVAVIVETTPGDLTDKTVIASVKSRLAGFKVPKAVVFVDELPRNTMGKVQKKQLRETYQDLLKTSA